MSHTQLPLKRCGRSKSDTRPVGVEVALVSLRHEPGIRDVRLAAARRAARVDRAGVHRPRVGVGEVELQTPFDIRFTRLNCSGVVGGAAGVVEKDRLGDVEAEDRAARFEPDDGARRVGEVVVDHAVQRGVGEPERSSEAALACGRRRH